MSPNVTILALLFVDFYATNKWSDGVFIMLGPQFVLNHIWSAVV